MTNTDKELIEKNYRKKPVVIQAYQFTGAMLAAYIFEGTPLPKYLNLRTAQSNPVTKEVISYDVSISTLEGDEHYVSIGDWIITGVKGENYACKPDIFALTYEPEEATINAVNAKNTDSIESNSALIKENENG